MARRFFQVGLVIALVAFLGMGCALYKSMISELSAKDKALKLGAELMDSYTLLHKNAEDLYAEAVQQNDVETKEYLENEVNPKLNEAHELIKSYNKVALQWKKGELDIDPEKGLYETQQEINKLLTTALLSINTLLD